jgi:hypothetical protein
VHGSQCMQQPRSRGPRGTRCTGRGTAEATGSTMAVQQSYHVGCCNTYKFARYLLCRKAVYAPPQKQRASRYILYRKELCKQQAVHWQYKNKSRVLLQQLQLCMVASVCTTPEQRASRYSLYREEYCRSNRQYIGSTKIKTHGLLQHVQVCTVGSVCRTSEQRASRYLLYRNEYCRSTRQYIGSTTQQSATTHIVGLLCINRQRRGAGWAV